MVSAGVRERQLGMAGNNGPLVAHHIFFGCREMQCEMLMRNPIEW